MAMSPLRVQLGAKLLESLHDIPLIENLAERWCRMRQGLGTPPPLVRAILASLKTSYGDILSNAREHDLLEVSRGICLNSQKPLELATCATAQTYIESCVGQNLRWETLGILISIVGASAVTLPEGDKTMFSGDEYRNNRESFANEMAAQCDIVLSFCDHYIQPNDLMLWLMFENFKLVTMHRGDSSKHYDSLRAKALGTLTDCNRFCSVSTTWRTVRYCDRNGSPSRHFPHGRHFLVYG